MVKLHYLRKLTNKKTLIRFTFITNMGVHRNLSWGKDLKNHPRQAAKTTQMNTIYTAKTLKSEKGPIINNFVIC